MNCFLGLDIGTTSVKAAAFSLTGECLGSQTQDYALITPGVDRVELNPEQYWTSLCEVLQRLLADETLEARSISAIGVSSQGETTIAVDQSGSPLYPALVWLDNRAWAEAQTLADRLEPDVYRRTGIPSVNPTWTACKIAWIREHEPHIFKQTYKFLLAQNFIIHRLTGEFVTDGGVACTTLLLDINTHHWWSQALEAIGVTSDALPTLRRMGEIAGELTRAAGETLGLPPGIPVILGGMDQISGAVGAGNLKPEIVSESTGGALTIQVTVDRPDVDPLSKIPVYLHALSGKFLFDPVCDTGGMTLKWFRDVFGEIEVIRASKEKKNPYDLITQLASQIAPGCDGLIMLPHLTGAFSPEYNPYARGVYYGFTLAHQKSHFARAVLEAVAFMLRRNLERVVEAGIHINEIRATGGGARSHLWRQIKADVCNLPVVSLKYDDTALLGDAMLAAVGTGHFETLAQAADAMVILDERVEPVNTQHLIYDDAYRRYEQVYDALSPLFRDHFS
jgi:xylulokinase